jgi:hypothetical protein
MFGCCVTGGCSSIQFKTSTDLAARRFYLGNIVFSDTTVTTGGMAVTSRAYKISQAPAISEAWGIACYRLNKFAQEKAQQLENKKPGLPPRKFGVQVPHYTRIY